VLWNRTKKKLNLVECEETLKFIKEKRGSIHTSVNQLVQKQQISFNSSICKGQKFEFIYHWPIVKSCVG